MAQALKVPALGESVSEATVLKWLKKVGDSVKMDEALVELETDKVTVEVNAPSDGVLEDISAPEGANVEVGAVLGQIGSGSGKAAAPKTETKAAAAPAPAKSAPANDPVPATAAATPGPAARKALDEANLSAGQVQGSGKDGRVTKGDVQNYQPASAPTPAALQKAREAGPREERVKMTRLRQVIATRLKEAQNTAAMLTTFNEIDMTAAMALRKTYGEKFAEKHGVKLGFMSLFTKAAVKALQEFPAVNAEISGDEIIYKNHYDISVAVSTPAGLVVPVVRDADELSLAGIEKAIVDLGTRARDGKLAMSDMQGGTFTITNGGIFGSLLSTPIINAPQTGILGLHKIEERAVVQNGQIVARPMMYVALSYDHRLIDGKEAVSFLVRVKEAMEDPARILLEI
ncbi:MAG TPA: 2-oxoglutarate dehydrogenase complex dihydrolipoyllysine-residue succinyltransferase [Alphaproteobacteria bacterium]|nr:dihydrolipoamide succinyltransferase [Rhodospirillaceae bacterium]HRJ12534.1 2-oxoglutarate dehydrogenase complex dihydrolipoyllysine-residue succinyltransferase [Alphaproteobacteria bacterium]